MGECGISIEVERMEEVAVAIQLLREEDKKNGGNPKEVVTETLPEPPRQLAITDITPTITHKRSRPLGRTWKKWTAKDIAYLKARFKEGVELDTVAREMWRTRDSLTRRLTILGLMKRKYEKRRRVWTSDEELRLVSMVKDGKGRKTVADALGKSIGSVQAKSYEVGVGPAMTRNVK